MTRQAFEQLVTEAVALIPPRFRREITNLAVFVESRPDAHLLNEIDIGPPDFFLDLYSNTPLLERGWEYDTDLPDRITLFQR
jgi:predicted Zn-dependent protease with MMP-like domain